MAFFTTGFDPYRKWLGIPENRRPPTYYSILAISRGENDDDVIRSAAQQRRIFIQSKFGEGHDKEVTKILREIDESVACLLVSSSKHEYDRRIGLTGKKNGKQKNHPLPPWFNFLPVRIYGEGSGIISSVAGIMAVICLAIGGMVWFSFQMPWEKLTNPENQTGMLSSVPLDEKIIPLRNEAPAPSSESIVAITPLPAIEAPTEPSPVKHPVVELQKTSSQVWLNTMPVIGKYDINGWTSTNGELLLANHSGKPMWRTKLNFDGSPSPNGIYQHATGHDRKASVTFSISKEFKRLETIAFIPSELPQIGNPHSPIIFEIIGDGRSLWKSNPLARKGDKQSCSVSVQGVDHLMLQVWTSGSNWWGLAAWHAPKLSNEHIDASLMSRTTSEAKPTPITTETVKPSFPLVVKILETKKQDWNLSKTDYVKINGKQFDLGMGNDRGGFGIAAAGWHLIGATKVSIKIKFSGIGRINDAHTFAGLIVDYRIGEKYTKRVSFNGMQVSKARTLNMPDWGRSAPPDLNVQLKEESYYEFDLQKWAPEGWRGETWVSMLLQNSGRNTMLQGEIQFEADR